MPGPPPPPYSASWRIEGVQNDSMKWGVNWHLSLPGATAFDYASVHRLHEDLLLLSEFFFGAVLADATSTATSRFNVTGPATSQGDYVFLGAFGSRGSPTPGAIAVPVRQIVQAQGRGRQGRFWLPAPSFSDVQFGFQLTPGAASHYASELTGLFDEVNGYSSAEFPSVRFAVLHRQERGAYLPNAIIEPVDTWVLSRYLGTQDRRLNRVRVP